MKAPTVSVKHRNDNHRLRSVAKVIENLLTDCSAEHLSFTTLADFTSFISNTSILETMRCGFVRVDKKACLWMKQNGQYDCIVVEREDLPLTRSEIGVLKSFEKVLDGSYSDSRHGYSQSASAIGVKYSLGNLLVASSIKGKASTGFYTLTLIFDELQELALQRYEGRPCNSGFIYISQPDEQIRQIDELGYSIDHFEQKILLEEGFFNGTVSHRYVDGRNSFYLIDNQRQIYGVARNDDPGKYSIYDRSSFKHIDDLFSGNNGKLYVAYVGRNNDVVVIGKDNIYYKWNKLYWNAIDRTILSDVIESETDLNKNELEALISCLLTCSDLRYGTLISINGNESCPSIGKIDNSPLSNQVLNINTSKPISEIKENGSALPILTSDGCVSLDMHGKLVSSGDILDLASDKIGGARLTGGGRTQAAQAASMFGLAIKVSEDGPITLFKDGKKIVELRV
ncbi:MAG: hypothetical protein AAGI14_06025 [Pseudomonadota bacterium]